MPHADAHPTSSPAALALIERAIRAEDMAERHRANIDLLAERLHRLDRDAANRAHRTIGNLAAQLARPCAAPEPAAAPSRPVATGEIVAHSRTACRIVLDVLRRRREATRPQLESLTGYSRSMIHNALSDLLAAGAIVCATPGSGSTPAVWRPAA